MSTKKVDDFFHNLKHPLKAEMEATRKIICAASQKIVEDVKWGGPSFDYKEPMATFNPRLTTYVAIIFHKGGLLLEKSELLEPGPKGKAYVKFHSMAEIVKHKAKLQQLIREWIKIMDT